MPSPDDRPAPRPPELDALPRDRRASDLLEERVVQELRRRGVLSSTDPVTRRSTHVARRPGGPGLRRSVAPAWAVAAAAAGLALFLGGYAVGQRHGASTAADLYTGLRQADARERAALVQRTGSLWVEALTAMADAAATSDDRATVAAGREAARAGLRAAVRELVRLEPDDGRLARAVAALEADAAPGDPSTDRTILWF